MGLEQLQQLWSTLDQAFLVQLAAFVVKFTVVFLIALHVAPIMVWIERRAPDLPPDRREEHVDRGRLCTDLLDSVVQPREPLGACALVQSLAELRLGHPTAASIRSASRRKRIARGAAVWAAVPS